MKVIPSKKYIGDVVEIQKSCVETFVMAIRLLRSGMSEKDIQVFIIDQLKKFGLVNYWYDIGVMVLIGEKRFLDMKEKDYGRKTPSDSILLQKGELVFIDMHPMNNEGVWGDFSSMVMYKPKPEDKGKVSFLEQIYCIHMDGIHQINSLVTGNDICSWYSKKYQNENIHLLDARENVGHTMVAGIKKYKNDTEKRVFLDMDNISPIGEGILAIEPGGYKKTLDGATLVGRFEDCIYVPKTGYPIILGRKDQLPMIVS